MNLTAVTLAVIVFNVGSNPLIAQPADKPIWAKQATTLDMSCTSNSLVIASPDHQATVKVICHKHKQEYSTYSLQVRTRAGQLQETPLEEGTHEELLWAPDSNAFFVDGGTSAYSGFFMTVYQITGSSGIRKKTITNSAQKDMVLSFPPCKAANRDEALCLRITKEPEYNMSGVAWTTDSSAIYVFAEVPCSSSYGGIMCQVLGYELHVPDGRILNRLTANQVLQQWRSFMAWDMHVPDPPIYGLPLQTR